MLGLDPSDVGMRKDATPPPYVLPVVQEMLTEPLINFSRNQEWAETVLSLAADSARMVKAVSGFTGRWAISFDVWGTG